MRLRKITYAAVSVLGLNQQHSDSSSNAAADSTALTRSRSTWALAARAFASNRLALVAVGYIIAMLLFCFIGPLFYHTNQFLSDIAISNLPPGKLHPLGTDHYGFDILGRLMLGGQNSLELAFAVAVASSIVGMIWGGISAYLGGWVDSVMSRILDVGIAIPAIFLFVFLASVFRPDKLLIILVLTAIFWMMPARLVRGETLSLRTREFVAAARLSGNGPVRILITHIFRNVLGTLAVSATLQATQAILILATLNFFGFGLPPPNPSWGGMLSGGINYLYAGYWWQIFPAALVITTIVVALSIAGDGLQDSVDVRLQGRGR
ncbi:MAG TPA: ABC transporter permease [Gammaproteobacteria bacterium]|nr:ABC transporter permease [Gammaproteobacteria bacterium]